MACSPVWLKEETLSLRRRVRGLGQAKCNVWKRLRNSSPPQWFPRVRATRKSLLFISQKTVLLPPPWKLIICSSFWPPIRYWSLVVSYIPSHVRTFLHNPSFSVHSCNLPYILVHVCTLTDISVHSCTFQEKHMCLTVSPKISFKQLSNIMCDFHRCSSSFAMIRVCVWHCAQSGSRSGLCDVCFSWIVTVLSTNWHAMFKAILMGPDFTG